MSTHLILNVAPILFDDAVIDVGVFPYRGKDQLRTLRQKHHGTHFLRREGNEIVSVALVQNAPVLGESVRSLCLSDAPYLCAALARDALLAFCARINRPSPTYDPIRIPGGNAEGSYLLDAVGGAGCPPWLSVRPRFLAATRVMTLTARTPFAALTLDVESARIIDASCAALLDAGLSLAGLYVGRRERQLDPRLADRFVTVGRVDCIEDGRIILADAKDVTEIPLDEAFLEPGLDAFERCLNHAFGAGAGHVKEALEARLAGERQGPRRLERLRVVLKILSQQRLTLLPGTPFTFDSFLGQDAAERFPRPRQAPRPVYVFDATGARTNNWNDGGLATHGPYSRGNFTPSRPRVCVVCQKGHKGQVEQFLAKFREGIPPARSGKAPFAKGFVRKYALDGVDFEFFITDNDTATAYLRATRQAIQVAAQRGTRWDLAMVQIEERFHDLYGDANPYLVTKAAFLTEHIPTQSFEIETARLTGAQLAYAVNNMALATYAKIGGIPWLLKADQTIAHEFVVGLGSATIGAGRFGERERVVGITSVFKGDGNYFLSNLTQAAPMKDYREALLDSLRITIDRVRRDMNWRPRESVRLVFHAFKPMRFDEADAVKALMEELGDYNVEFAFLHVKDHTPLLLFDEEQEGVRHYTGELKGTLAPTRGLFFAMSERESLICLTGPRELKKPQDGLPRPVLLELHPSSTFQDMTYLTKQVFAFSCHSWRSFFPAPMPVTILYSDLVASMLGKLDGVTRWNPDALLGRIGTTRWFL